MNYYEMVRRIIFEFENVFEKLKEPFPKEDLYFEFTKRYGVGEKLLDKVSKKLMPKYNIKLNMEGCFEKKDETRPK